MSQRGPNLNPGETGWEKFNRLWRDHGHGSAKSWARAHAPAAADAWVSVRREMGDDAGVLAEPETTPMFAYGMNMPASRMGVGSNPRAALLEGFALEFSHFANVVPGDENDFVPGTLWDSTPWDLRGLDALEGVDHAHPERGLYRRETVTVTTADGPVEAVAYVMNPRPTAAPDPHYLAVMMSGYDDFDHPWGPMLDALRHWPDLEYRVREYAP